jgi:hypothetical protein
MMRLPACRGNCRWRSFLSVSPFGRCSPGLFTSLVGPVLSWIAANAGLLADSGKDLATTAGAGKEIGNIVDGLNVSGLLGQVIAVLGVILKPMIVIVGAIGALALIAAPRFCRNWDGCWPRADTDWRPNGFCGGAALLDADAEKAEPRTSAIWQVRD